MKPSPSIPDDIHLMPRGSAVASSAPATTVAKPPVQRARRPALAARRLPPASLWIALPGLLFLVLPILLIVPMSFTGGEIIEFPPSTWGLNAYREAFADAGWRASVLFSLGVASLSVLISVLVGASAAIGVSRHGPRWASLLSAIVLVPLSMPVIVLALGNFQALNDWGLTGTTTGFVIAHSVLGAPYVFVTVRAALAKLDASLIRSAVSLGAGAGSVLAWIVVPSIYPALLSGALLVFIVSFDEVVISLFISGPGTVTFPVKLFTDVQFNLSPAIMAVSTLLLGIIVATVLIGTATLGARRTIYRIAATR